MKPSKQDFFNNYRQSTIIEVVQAIAKSRAGAQIVFKGGTALKLFCGLPRYSEDIDYDSLPGVPPQELMRTLKELFVKRRWEITDEAIKYFTILLELRFAGPDMVSGGKNVRLTTWRSPRKPFRCSRWQRTSPRSHQVICP